jgi:release factor glutamine methyltransferase
MITLIDAIQKTTVFFSAKRIENARLNAEIIIAKALNLNRLDLYLQFDRPLDTENLDQIRDLVRRRGKHEPWQYIFGEVDFFNLNLKVDHRALIPRPETEELIDLIIKIKNCAPDKIVDLGTGSGAIALALAMHYPESRVLAVDTSDEALSLARDNIKRSELNSRVEIQKSDWFNEIEGKFDLIVANPPYLSELEWDESQPEIIKFEPREALVAEENGLNALKHILSRSLTYLNEGGLVAMETGIDHHPALKEIAVKTGFGRWDSQVDFNLRNRYFFAWK